VSDDQHVLRGPGCTFGEAAMQPKQQTAALAAAALSGVRRWTGPAWLSLRAVALLELLPRAAPARVVASDLLLLGDNPLLGGNRPAAHADLPGRHARTHARGRDHVGAGERLVLVRAPVAVHVGLLPLKLCGIPRLDLRMEEQRQHLLVDEHPELLE